MEAKVFPEHRWQIIRTLSQSFSSKSVLEAVQVNFGTSSSMLTLKLYISHLKVIFTLPDRLPMPTKFSVRMDITIDIVVITTS